MPTGPVPVDVNNLNATWTRLQFVNQQYAGFQRESCDIQRTLWTNIHTLLGQKTALEKSWWDINTAYNSKADELTEMAQNSVVLQEELQIAQDEIESARARPKSLKAGTGIWPSSRGSCNMTWIRPVRGSTPWKMVLPCTDVRPALRTMRRARRFTNWTRAKTE